MSLSRSVSSQDEKLYFQIWIPSEVQELLVSSSELLDRMQEWEPREPSTRQEHGVALLLITGFFSFPRREAKTRSSIKTTFSSPQTRTFWGEERSS